MALGISPKLHLHLHRLDTAWEIPGTNKNRSDTSRTRLLKATMPIYGLPAVATFGAPMPTSLG